MNAFMSSLFSVKYSVNHFQRISKLTVHLSLNCSIFSNIKKVLIITSRKAFQINHIFRVYFIVTSSLLKDATTNHASLSSGI